jgi:hypothetical protein
MPADVVALDMRRSPGRLRPSFETPVSGGPSDEVSLRGEISSSQGEKPAVGPSPLHSPLGMAHLYAEVIL